MVILPDVRWYMVRALTSKWSNIFMIAMRNLNTFHKFSKLFMSFDRGINWLTSSFWVTIYNALHWWYHEQSENKSRQEIVIKVIVLSRRTKTGSSGPGCVCKPEVTHRTTKVLSSGCFLNFFFSLTYVLALTMWNVLTNDNLGKERKKKLPTWYRAGVTAKQTSIWPIQRLIHLC